MSREADSSRDESPVARYVSGDAGDSASPAEPGDLEVFARCDAVLAVAPRLADSPELAWAYAEARKMARGQAHANSLPWYRRVAIAWSAAAASTAVAAILAAIVLLPPAKNDATAISATARTGVEDYPSTAEIASRVADFAPEVLIGESVAVNGRSLVVLPFSSATVSLKSQAAANGVTAETLYDRLVHQLAAMPGIYVIDPTTAAVYADGSFPPEQIALFLGVRGVVQGSVDADDDTVSLDFRFTDAAGAGRAIDRMFERPVAELAMLQNDVALSLLDALGEASTPFVPQP